MPTIDEIENELTRKVVHRTSLVDKLANKGYKFRDVANMPRSRFTKKRKRKRKKKK